MFIGEHRHNMDEKGRLQVPVKWRSKLAEGAVLTKGFDGSLKCYPLAVWQGIAERLAALPQSQPEARAYVRQTLAGAVDVELDKLGRMVLPQYLRQYAGLAKQTVLAGLHDHFEIWQDQSWNDYVSGAAIDDPAYAQVLKDMGI
jgi:MraZ protein